MLQDAFIARFVTLRSRRSLRALTQPAALVSSLALGLSLTTGCTGLVGGSKDDGPQAATGAGAPNGSGGAGATNAGSGGGNTAPLGGPGRVVMHRLSPREYDNTVRDLFGTTERLSSNFPPDFAAFGFDNVAESLNMTDASFGYFSEAAKRIAADVLSPAKRSNVVGCDLAAEKEACVRSALTALLPKAWRRPIESGDVEPLVSLYGALKADGNSDDEAFARVLQAVLLAPEFLYRVERNTGVAGVRELQGHELASRLSYFLWSSMPDPELLSAGMSGALGDPVGLAAQVTRMLASEKASAFAENFGSQWLPVRGLENVSPDPNVYPDFDESLRAAMRAETMRFFVDVAKGSRSLGELLTSNSSYVNDRLARHYGLAPVGSDTPVFTPLPAGRAGLLSQGALLTVLSYPNESHPVRRGKWILAQLLCREPPPPPPNIPEEPPASAGKSRKERLLSHQSEPICKSCHQLMDPLGLALEQYDGIGAYRTVDAGVPIDPSGVFDEQPFATPAELAQLVARSPSVSRCVTKHVFTYGLGRAPREGSDYDAQALDEAGKSFTDSGQLFPQLVQAIVTSNVFRKREDEAATP